MNAKEVKSYVKSLPVESLSDEAGEFLQSILDVQVDNDDREIIASAFKLGYVVAINDFVEE
jgi:hypothetical protein